MGSLSCRLPVLAGLLYILETGTCNTLASATHPSYSNMAARFAFGVSLLAALATQAAPALTAAPAPVKVSLGMHKLADGQYPRARARLSRSNSKATRAVSAVSEPLSDYYLGTDLQ